MTYLDEGTFDAYMAAFRAAPELTVDTEGTLNHPHAKTWGLSCSANGVSEYFAFKHALGSNLPWHWSLKLKEVIENHPRLIFHNAKHDLRALRAMDIHANGPFYDTMLMAHWNDENLMSKELDWLSKRFGGQPKRTSELQDGIIKAFGWSFIPVEIIREYGANDAYITEELKNNLFSDFVSQGFDGELWDTEQKFIRLMGKIENQGSLIDQDLSQKELERGLIIMKELTKELGFNPGSTKQLGKFLLEDLGLPVFKRTENGNPSFDKEAMREYDALLQAKGDKRALQVLAYRGWSKTTGSNYKPYLELLDHTGRLHPNFKLHGTVTGRMSCEKPNLQQIPREGPNDWNGHLKKAFIVAPGRTAWEVDYSQLEFRLGAAYGKERTLIDIFADPNRDLFDEMSAELNMERHDVKTMSYTIQYGGGAKRLSNVFGITISEAQNRLKTYYRNYPGLARASNKAKARVEDVGFLRYWTGRRRHLSPYDSHKAFSSLIQGGAFEIVKRKMIEVDEAGLNNDECRMDLQVHDSVRFDIEDGKEGTYLPEIQRIMDDVQWPFGVKFKTGVKKWADAP